MVGFVGGRRMHDKNIFCVANREDRKKILNKIFHNCRNEKIFMRGSFLSNRPYHREGGSVGPIDPGLGFKRGSKGR